MKSVTCAVLGAGNVVRVDIEEYKKVAHLKNAIKAMLPSTVQCDAPDLTLYVAKKGVNWLNSNDPDVSMLKEGELPDGIHDIMKTKGSTMNPNLRVANVAFDFPDSNDAGETDLHVLVAVPGQEIGAPSALLFYSLSMDEGCMTFKDVDKVMPAVQYDQPRKPISDDKLDMMYSYLLLAVQSFGALVAAAEGSRKFLVGPVLACVCALFGGDATLLAGESVVGRQVRGDETFEFVVRRGGKRVCVVEAKNGDIDQGLSHAYVGGEVLADTGDLSTVFAIATNFHVWSLSKFTNETVEREIVTMALVNSVPTRDSVQAIAEKIYAMLSDHD